MTDYDINEIADARYMGLMCPPASPEARALVDDIIVRDDCCPQRLSFQNAAN